MNNNVKDKVWLDPKLGEYIGLFSTVRITPDMLNHQYGTDDDPEPFSELPPELTEDWLTRISGFVSDGAMVDKVKTLLSEYALFRFYAGESIDTEFFEGGILPGEDKETILVWRDYCFNYYEYPNRCFSMSKEMTEEDFEQFKQEIQEIDVILKTSTDVLKPNPVTDEDRKRIADKLASNATYGSFYNTDVWKMFKSL